MVTSYREETFQRGRRDALGALVDALKEERIPVRSRYGLTTGKIEEYLDDIYLPLQPRTLLSVLREVGVPHDTKYRFLTWALYAHQEQLQELYERWLGERMQPLPPGGGWVTSR